MKKDLKIIGILLLTLTVGFFPSQVRGQTVANFFKGKTIKLIVGEKPGGGTDLTARTVALHLSRHLGASVIVLNKTGAAHAEGMNFTWNAKPDGLTIGCEDLASLITNDLQDAPGIQYQVDKLNFFGSIADEEVMFWVNANGPIKSIQDLKAAKGVKLAATSVSGMRAINQLMIAYILDLDAKVITGFKGSQECDLAIMQGEATGTTSSPLSYRRGVKNGTHRGLFTLDVRRNQATPDVPAITELVKPPKEKMDLLNLMVTLRPSKAFYGPPGIPKDKVDFIQKAYNDVTSQAKFKAEIEKLHYPGVPIVEGKILAERAQTMKKNKKLWQDSFKSLFDKYRG